MPDLHFIALDLLPTADIITRWDKEFRLVYANKSFEIKTGISRETVYGKNIADAAKAAPVITPWMESLRTVLQTGDATELDHSFSTPDGAAFFHCHLVPEKNADGEIETLLAIASDVTALKKSEAELRQTRAALTQQASVEKTKAAEELRRSKEQLRLILESANGFAIFTTTADGIVNSWNAGAAQIFEWTEEEIIGQSGDILFIREDRATNQPQIERETAISNGRAPDIRWHLRKSGSLVFINGFAHPIYDDAGRLNGFVKVGRDVTAQHNAEEALRKSEETYRSLLEKEVEERTAALEETNRNLRYANENLQQFASIASHDLQEPLRKLKMFTAVLNTSWSSIVPPEAKEVIDKIIVASNRMGQLISEVLGYSKIAYGAREYSQTNLDQVLQDTLLDLSLLLEETAATVDYYPPLPVIDAIPLQMHQLFYNLLTNALKFRKENLSPLVRISHTTLSSADAKKHPELTGQGPYLEITVADNGIGFNPQFSEQIFRIFERLHSADEFEGTGVGLALCKKIAENHRGYIYAISKEGEGASFHVILPLKQ